MVKTPKRKEKPMGTEAPPRNVRKKAGRPPSQGEVRDRAFTIRTKPSLVKMLDRLRAKEEGCPTRPRMIEILIERAGKAAKITIE